MTTHLRTRAAAVAVNGDDVYEDVFSAASWLHAGGV